MRRLFEDCMPHVYRFALRLTGDLHRAEDLTQEVMLRAWCRRHSLRDRANVRGWLLRITVNAWNDELRKRRTLPKPVAIETAGPANPIAMPDYASIQREDVKRAMEALDQLPDRQRSVVYLHVCEQLSLSEIATVLAISYTAAKASLSAGRQQLRRTLKDVYSNVNSGTIAQEEQ